MAAAAPAAAAAVAPTAPAAAAVAAAAAAAEALAVGEIRVIRPWNVASDLKVVDPAPMAGLIIQFADERAQLYSSLPARVRAYALVAYVSPVLAPPDDVTPGVVYAVLAPDWPPESVAGDCLLYSSPSTSVAAVPEARVFKIDLRRLQAMPLDPAHVPTVLGRLSRGSLELLLHTAGPLLTYLRTAVMRVAAHCIYTLPEGVDTPSSPPSPAGSGQRSEHPGVVVAVHVIDRVTYLTHLTHVQPTSKPHRNACVYLAHPKGGVEGGVVPSADALQTFQVIRVNSALPESVSRNTAVRLVRAATCPVTAKTSTGAQYFTPSSSAAANPRQIAWQWLSVWFGPTAKVQPTAADVEAAYALGEVVRSEVAAALAAGAAPDKAHVKAAGGGAAKAGAAAAAGAGAGASARAKTKSAGDVWLESVVAMHEAARARLLETMTDDQWFRECSFSYGDWEDDDDATEWWAREQCRGVDFAEIDAADYGCVPLSPLPVRAH